MRAEEYHEDRARELGLPVGTGKRYDAETLESFYFTSLPPFEQKLFQDGLLPIDTDYIDKIVDEFLPKKTKTARQKALAENDLANLRYFGILVEPLTGTIPARWGITQQILDDLNNAHENGVQLSGDLIRFAIIHPSMQVRSAAWERQDLTNSQKVVAAYMGVKLTDRAENRRAQGIGYTGAAFGFPFAVFAEYGIDFFPPEPTEQAGQTSMILVQPE